MVLLLTIPIITNKTVFYYSQYNCLSVFYLTTYRWSQYKMPKLHIFEFFIFHFSEAARFPANFRLVPVPIAQLEVSNTVM